MGGPLKTQSWEMREQLRPEFSRRQRGCGTQRYVREPIVKGNEYGSYFDGVVRCRSRICPVCFLSRRMQLLAELQYVASERSRVTSTPPYLATLTVRHSHTDYVSITRDVRSCWRRFIAGREWMTFRKMHDVEWVCAEEITLGKNGWHPHIHVAMLPRKPLNDVYLGSGAGSWWLGRWASIVEKHMGPAHVPDAAHGCDIRQGPLADYVAKIAWELSDAALQKGSSPQQLIRRGDTARYLELQRHRHRARDVTWSRGLRSLRDDFANREQDEPHLRAILRGSEYERLASKGFSALLAVSNCKSSDDVALELAARGCRAEALGPSACAAHLDSLTSRTFGAVGEDEPGPPQGEWDGE